MSRVSAFAILLFAAGVATAQVCDDQSYVSLDEDCSVLVTPDMVLEGTPPPGAIYLLTLSTASGLPVANPVTGAQIGQTLLATVTDIATGNSCEGLLTIEDKLPPLIECTDISIPCAVSDYSPDYLATIFQLSEAFPEVTDNCGPYTLGYVDTWFDLGCSDPDDRSAYVERVWTAADPSGNSASCTQYIFFYRVHLFDLTFPPDVTVSCTNPATAPAQTGTPFFTAFGQNIPVFPNSSYCELNLTYSDQVLPVCDGSTTILRTWTVFDWCLPFNIDPPFPNPLQYIQVILIADTEGPAFGCPNDTILISNPFDCHRDFELHDFIVTDHCSQLNSVSAEWITPDGTTHVLPGTLTDFPGNNLWNPDTLAVLGLAEDLPGGLTVMQYIVQDDCGNSTVCEFEIIVTDSIAPAAACQQLTQVAIALNGMALVNAQSFDAGSFDNCSPVRFKARRAEPNDCQSNEFFYDQVKFCCEDVGDTVDVILRVYDVPVDTGAVGLNYKQFNASDCQVQALVEDKFKPVCAPPFDVTVSCENFDPSLSGYGMAQGGDNCCLDTITIIKVNYLSFDTLCNRGTVTRTFRVEDCSGNSSSCNQKIVVDYEQDYYIKFPDDLIVYTCDTNGTYPPPPQVFGVDCELIGITYEDSPFQSTPGACFKIERTWKVINWCTYDPNLPFIVVPNPSPVSDHNSPLNLPGPVVAPLGSTPPPSVIKISPTDPIPTNYSIFWSADANGYLYKQIITVEDQELPKIRSCPLLNPIPVCDKSPNDPQFWNAPYYVDPLIPGSHDLCEVAVDLSLSANDACTGGEVNIRYLLFLDLDNDGIQETVINSSNLPPPNTVYFGNALLPNYVGGTPYQFDQRPVPDNQKYRFTIQIVPSFFRSARVRWNTIDNPDVYVQPVLPHGLHRILWIVEDGCGNQDFCDYGILIEDCKAPTVTCVNGLSVNIMPSGVITLWANDFLLYAEDNCTPDNLLEFSMRKDTVGDEFPLDANGNPVTSLTFTCDELGPQPIEIWAMDASGNAGYCETYVDVQDPFGYCLPPAPLSAAGLLQTEPLGNNLGIDDAGVALEVVPPDLPAFSSFDLTDGNGLFLFGGLIPFTSDYTVTPTKDDNPMNGVSTFDLALMSKHILGITPLSTPYQMIAADINLSNSVTSFDIIELRKLILGIYTDFPNNTSWRFIDRDFTFAQANNPFASAPFPEKITVTGAQSTLSDLDFVGIKIGDVNNSVIPNVGGSEPADDRGGGAMLFDLDDRAVQAGDIFSVTLQGAEKVLGYQFTLIFNDLEILDVLPGAGLGLDNFGIFASLPDGASGAVTMSVVGDASEFTLQFRALAAGRLSDLLRISSSITRAEAYRPNDPMTSNDPMTKTTVALRFNSPEGQTVAGVGFELYQNQPNPFFGKTRIGFHLPEAAEATLAVFDGNGRTLLTQTGDFAQGANFFTVAPESRGPLAYRVTTPFGSATRIMMRVQ